MTVPFEMVIDQIKPLRESVLHCLSDEQFSELHDLRDLHPEAVTLLASILNLPVSKLSVLKDAIWDFNNENELLARDIQGAKSRIDFSQYTNLNSTILFELKISMLCIINIPGAFKTRIKKKSKSRKTHTILEIFKSTIPFIDRMCARKRSRQGEEFFELSHFSLANFSEEDYKIEAREFDRAFRGVTNQGFNLLRSYFLLENLFATPLCTVDLESLEWIQNSVTKPSVRKKQKYLDNKIFEKCSRSASLCVVDFLSALNEKIEDTTSLETAKFIKYSEAARFKLSQTSFDIYVAIRLTSRGYTGAEIEPLLYCPKPEYWSPVKPNYLKDKEAICAYSNSELNDDFYNYIAHINNSALYIIAQYTGMRPSELSGVMTDSCLTSNEFGHNLIISIVIKHKEVYGKLFGDKWAAIPIVMDAVRVLRILNRFKRNPFLLSSMITVRPNTQDKANSLTGNGLTFQICRFLAEVLSTEELETIDVSTYTLRHSLAHQMYRASVGLPFISYQLKHFGNLSSAILQERFTVVTVDYGGIGDSLISGTGPISKPLRHEAERELIVNICDPEGGYAGENAEAHRQRLKKYFLGYLEQGYTKDEIFDRMVEQHFAIINVGQGYCYGDTTDPQDDSIPCRGSLRCNPNLCKNAVVTKANAPKWHEVYLQNSISLRKLESIQLDPSIIFFEPSELERSIAQLKLVIAEAKAVLEGLGEELLA
ncbi:site-specific integrase [Pseudomonas aeruginosa]